MNSPICLLVDNGSLRADSILSLRKVANRLSSELSLEVIPVGLLHSNKINPSELDGVNAHTIETFLSSEVGKQSRNLLIIPFFFGPSRGITDFLQRKLLNWEACSTERSFKILPCLHKKGDLTLAKALFDETIKIIKEKSFSQPHVVMVDHGSPVSEVNDVREEVGRQLAKLLTDLISGFSTSSMERRAGKEYDFNEPLVENVLHGWGGNNVKQVVVPLLFLLPGRHAGEGGDLHNIFDKTRKEFDGIKIYPTNPLGLSEGVYKILKSRADEYFKKS